MNSKKTNIGYFIYSHSEFDDLWDACFSRLEQHGMGFDNYYLFTDAVNKEIPEFITPIFYDDTKLFSEKLTMCIEQIKDEYVIYTHDDNFLKGDVDLEKIVHIKDMLDDSDMSFVHLLRSGVPCLNQSGFTFIELVPYKEETNLYYLQDESKQYVGQPVIWNRKKFLEVVANNKATNSTARNRGEKTRDLESVETHTWMIKNDIRGCFYFNAEKDIPLQPKNITWSSTIFPTMNGVRKGKWYITEHEDDLIPLFAEFDINPMKRGMM